MLSKSVTDEISKQFKSTLDKADEDFKHLNVQIKKRANKNSYVYFLLFPYEVFSFFKKMFLSTIVVRSTKTPLHRQELESLEIEINSQKKNVTILNIKRHIPQNDPYYEYMLTQFSGAWVPSMNNNPNQNRRVHDFYDLEKASRWKNVEELEQEKDELFAMPGIYMLFQEDGKKLYIGTAGDIKKRILQHRKKEDDEMKDFTHYRYSHFICY